MDKYPSFVYQFLGLLGFEISLGKDFPPPKRCFSRVRAVGLRSSSSITGQPINCKSVIAVAAITRVCIVGALENQL